MKNGRLETSRVILAALLVLAATGGTRAAEPTLEDALAAPAGDLAQGYLLTRYMLKNVLPYAEMGVVDTIHVGGTKITARNASKIKKQYKERSKTYAQAIRQRGSVSLAGSYRGEATEPCARVNLSWIALIESGDATAIEIVQKGPDASLNLSISHEGATSTLKYDAAVVESSILVVDQMNSDYYAVGEVADGKITIRPDVRVLDGWPEWAGPPRREDLLACVVALDPIAAGKP